MIERSFLLGPRPGDTIRGDVRIPEGPPPRTAIVVVHGFKGFKDWGFFPYLARRLAAAGHAVISFNFSRSGVGEDPDRFGELEKFARNTLSLELEEVHRVLAEVRTGELLPRRPDRIGLLGHSRGGGDAVLAAAEDGRVSALVTWAAVSSFDRWSEETKSEWRREGRVWILNQRTGEQMPLEAGLLEDFEAHRERLDIGAAAGRLDVPWLIVHGTDDLTVKPSEAHTLLAASRGARLRMIEGAGHTFEARHPFERTTPELEVAIEESVRHFEEALGG